MRADEKPDLHVAGSTHSIRRYIFYILVGASKIGGWCVVVLSLITLFDVISRRLFPVNSTALQESEWHLHTILFTLTIGYALVRDRHVRVDLVSSALSSRTRAWIEVVGAIILLYPIIIILFLNSLDFVAQSWRYNESSPSSGGLPFRYIIKTFIPICMGLILLAGLSAILRNIAIIQGKESDPDFNDVLTNPSSREKGDVK